jgi:hypothetical protein
MGTPPVVIMGIPQIVCLGRPVESSSVIAPRDLGVVAFGCCEDAGEQPLLRCEELDPDEASGLVEVEDDAIVGVLGSWRGDRLGGDGADVVVVSAQAEVCGSDLLVVGESHVGMIAESGGFRLARSCASVTRWLDL